MWGREGAGLEWLVGHGVSLYFIYLFILLWASGIVSYHGTNLLLELIPFAVYGVSVASSPCRLIKVKVIAYPSRILSKNPSTAGERLGIWSTALPAA